MTLIQNQPASVSDEEIKQLVLARLKSFPQGYKLSIGSSGAFSKRDLISHVRQADEIGRKIITVHLEYLRSLKQGNLA